MSPDPRDEESNPPKPLSPTPLHYQDARREQKPQWYRVCVLVNWLLFGALVVTLLCAGFLLVGEVPGPSK